MPVSFSNPTVDFIDLPQLEDHQFTPVESAYFWLRLVTATGAAVVLLVALIGLSLADVGVSGVQFIGVALGLVVVLTAVGLYQRLEVARMGYALRQHDFSFRIGVIRTSVSTIPFSRVQNVAIDRGPLFRIFGIANLRVHSAGGTLHVRGVTYESAERLKSFIVDQARIAADQEQAAR